MAIKPKLTRYEGYEIAQVAKDLFYVHVDAESVNRSTGNVSANIGPFSSHESAREWIAHNIALSGRLNVNLLPRVTAND